MPLLPSTSQVVLSNIPVRRPKNSIDRRAWLALKQTGRPGMLPPPECRHFAYLGEGNTRGPPVLEQGRGRHANSAITPDDADLNDLNRRRNP